MPDCMVVVKRNLDREDGFEEVYLNKAFKNKKSLIDSFESNVLLKIFRDRYIKACTDFHTVQSAAE